MKKLIAGNWKMHGTTTSLDEITALSRKLTPEDVFRCDILLCPPATVLAAAAERATGTPLLIGAQDCHPGVAGAHTGDISAGMLVDAGAAYVIVGHSERRADHHETNVSTREKAEAAHRAGLIPIVCVGESLAQRQSGRAVTTVLGQVEASIPTTPGEYVLAYEPVWAIGTGVAAGPENIAEMHSVLRSAMGRGVRLLYGGSVKPGNAREILATPNVDGALVGGASLKHSDFYGIIAAA